MHSENSGSSAKVVMWQKSIAEVCLVLIYSNIFWQNSTWGVGWGCRVGVAGSMADECIT